MMDGAVIGEEWSGELARGLRELTGRWVLLTLSARVAGADGERGVMVTESGEAVAVPLSAIARVAPVEEGP